MEKQLTKKLSIISSSLKNDKQFTDLNISEIQKLISNNFVNSMFGCMFGAFIGDSLGSYCEFKKNISTALLLQTMKMPGKGTFWVKPGQFTDDSQLASHLLEGLVNYDPNLSFQNQKYTILFKIAQQYKTWYRSQPFDIGNTTRKAFSIINKKLSKIKEKNPKDIQNDQFKDLEDIHKQIRIQNKQSKSNGSLMRITPMAFFISLLLLKDKQNKLTCQDFKSFIKRQINMTHGNLQMHQIGYAWVQLLVSVILRKRTKQSLKTIYNNFIKKYQHNELTKEWIEASLNQKILDATYHQGRAIIAFSFGIKQLKQCAQLNQQTFNQYIYCSIIQRIIGRAGDTDTNGAIVGGLIGAILGFNNLPQKYLQKQFKLQLNINDEQCSNRPSFYQPNKQFFKGMRFLKKIQYFEN